VNNRWCDNFWVVYQAASSSRCWLPWIHDSDPSLPMPPGCLASGNHCNAMRDWQTVTSLVMFHSAWATVIGPSPPTTLLPPSPATRQGHPLSLKISPPAFPGPTCSSPHFLLQASRIKVLVVEVVGGDGLQAGHQGHGGIARSYSVGRPRPWKQTCSLVLKLHLKSLSFSSSALKFLLFKAEPTRSP